MLDSQQLVCYLIRMAEQSPQKGAPKVKRVHVALDEELHTEMKMRAAAARTTVKGYVIEAIRRAVKEGKEGGGSSKK